MWFDVVIAFLARLSLVLLFLPFSALDKLINMSAATDQARDAVASRTTAQALVLAGLIVEVVMSAAILTGVADRAAAFVLSGYCAVTAVLWKPFWRAPDFRLRGASRGREVFWDFLKNFALAGGFLALACGPTADGVARFLREPFASTSPYRHTTQEVRP